MHTTDVRLQAAMLFGISTAVGAERALINGQDLVEWHDEALRSLESAKSLKHLLACFSEHIEEFPELYNFLLFSDQDILPPKTNFFRLLEQLKQDAEEAL